MRNEDAGSSPSEHYPINRWRQIYHTVRTQVASIHHNISAALGETFGGAWCPSGKPVWLLGHRYLPEPEHEPSASARSGHGAATSCHEEHIENLEMPTPVEGLVTEEAPWPCRACSFLNHHLLDHCEMCDTPREVVNASSAKDSCKPAAGKGSNSAPAVRYKTPDEFIEAWSQIPRMTYRKGFAPMYRCVEEGRKEYVQLTSDAGWGCMIRVGQMQLATALKRHHDQSARLGSSTPSSDTLRPSSEVLHPIEHQFLDDKRSPFSIFRFIEVALGREVTATQDKSTSHNGSRRADGARTVQSRPLTKKEPGEWFGPTTITETLAAIVEQSPLLRNTLAVYVNVDGMLYEDEVRSLAYGEECEVRPPPVQATFSERKVRCSSGGDSEEEFTVVTTAPVMSATNLLHSPQLSTAASSPKVANLDSSTDLDELRELQLPPPVVDEDVEYSLTAADSPTQLRSESSASEGPPLRWRKAVLLLFPKRLGLEKNVSKYYVNAVLRYFELKHSLGAMGGRPRMAHFFVGRQDRELLYVDPHVVQPAALPLTEGEGSDGGFIGAETFKNVPTVQTINVEHIDSSVSFAFYCSSEEDLAELIKDLHAIDREEEDALIRCEPERPPELRGQQVCGAEAWPGCENDNICHDFPEVMSDFANEVMELSGESPTALAQAKRKCGPSSEDTNYNHRVSEGSYDFCETANADSAHEEARGKDIKSTQMAEPDSIDGYHATPTMCIGSAWASIEAPP